MATESAAVVRERVIAGQNSNGHVKRLCLATKGSAPHGGIRQVSLTEGSG